MSPHKPAANTFEIQASRSSSKAKKNRSATPTGWRRLKPVAKAARANPFNAEVAQSDPYFVWAQSSGARRLGGVKAAKTNYLQVAVEISGGDEAARQPVFAALKAAGMKVRNAYWEQSVDGKDVERFFTALIDEKKMADFVEAVNSVGSPVKVRFELGHPVIQPTAVAKTRHPLNEPDEKIEDVKLDKPLKGTVIAIIDYGCPFAHAAFLDSEKKSRVRYVWLQDTSALLSGARYDLPRVKNLINGDTELFPYGVELRPSLLDDVLKTNLWSGPTDENACYEAVGYDLMREATTHGAHVLSIAAGNFNPLNDSRDWASEAQIIFVQLPRAAVADASGGSMNCHVVDALRYIRARTDPTADVVVNMSFGTHAGPHDGTSMLERAIDHSIERRSEGKFKVVIPAGNSFNAACHAQLTLPPNASPQELHWEVMPDDLTDSFLEIWYGGNKDEANDINVEIQEPFSSVFLAPVKLNQVASWYGDRPTGKDLCNEPACTIVHTESSERADGHQNRVVLIALAPTRNDEQDQAEARYGVWKIRITNNGKKPVVADAWIERDEPILDLGGSCRQSRFVVEPQEDVDDNYLTPPVTKFCTLNSYATAQHVHTVGAAVKRSDQAGTFYGASPVRAAHYSSAGPGRGSKVPAIDWVAYSEESDVLPGINAAGTRSRYWVRRDGTSVAAPQVARALLNAMSIVGPPIDKPVNGPRSPPPGNGISLQKERIADKAQLVDW